MTLLTAPALTKSYTTDDLLRMEDSTGWELVDGQLRERTVSTLVVQQGVYTFTGALTATNLSVQGDASILFAAASAGTMALGAIQNNNGLGDALYGSGTALGLFDGQSPVITDVLVKYTYYGDTNLYGKVDGGDFSRTDFGSLFHLTGWFNNGDFNYDGVVNSNDDTLLDAAFTGQ